MRKKIITAVLAVMMSISLVPASVPVMAQEVAVEQSYADTAKDLSTNARFATWEADSKTYTKGATNLLPSYTITLNDGTPLVKDFDYTATWADSSNKTVTSATDAGTYTLTIEGMAPNYKGKLTKTFSISKATPVISKANDGTTTDKGIEKTYDGKPVTYTYSITANGVDVSGDFTSNFTIKDSKNQTIDNGKITEPGTYTVNISIVPNTGLEKNYSTASSFSDTIRINKVNLSSLYLVLDSNKITYDGKKHTPTYTLHKGSSTGIDVTNDVKNDVTITSGKDVTSISNYTFTITAKNDSAHYTGSVSAGFSIAQNDGTKGIDFTDGTNHTEDNILVEDISTQTYTGSPLNPAVTVYYKKGTGVKDKGEKLTLGKDYSVEYSNNTEVTSAGSLAKATIKGMGRFNNQTIEKTFLITGKPVSKLNISTDKASYEFTGATISPVITVKDGNKTLTQGTYVKPKDYTVTYATGANLTNAGTVIYYINGQGNYSGTVQKTFKITPHALKDAELRLDPDSKTYNKTDSSSTIPAQTTNVLFTYGRTYSDKNVSSIPGISVSYSNNTKAGHATVTITGSDNFSGTVRKTLAIVANNANAKDISVGTLGTIDAIADQTYTGSQLKPGVSVKYNGVALRNGSDYTVSYETNTAVGTGSVSVTGINDYKGTISKSFKINPTSIANASISLSNAEYTGGPTKPVVTATFAGNKLREGTDYRVDYSNNINKGTGTAKFQGLGNFTGTTTRTFSIVVKKDVDKKIYATSFTLPSTLTVSNGSTVRVNATFTPADTNASTIRWSTSNASFPFSDGFTAKTTEGEKGVDVKANAEGSTVITAELFDENSKSLGKQYTLVRTIKSFSDVGTDYSTTPINALANYGYTTGSGATQEFHSTPVINGTSSSTFTPTGDVKRADFVLMLYNKAVADYAAGKSTVDPSKAAASGFADVSSSAYYAPAVNWAVANGIAEGKGNNFFDPNGTVTRAEAVTFLQRYLKEGNAATNKFSDVSSGAYYAGAVGWAVNAGVTDGTSATTFSPNVKCNRAQAATFIYRAAF